MDVEPGRWPTRPAGLPAELDALRRTVVMGVLNVTPDSFSDGGRWLDPGAAVAYGTRMHRDGADLVDVGGESTRPGADRVPVEEELRRVLPVVTGLTGAGVPVSIDTMRSEVARAALDCGAAVVNDVSGGQADPGMLSWAATVTVPFVAMHWRGHSRGMDALASYGDVVADVRSELLSRLDAARDAGVDPARVVLDPGLGFAKRPAHNWALLQRLDVLVDTGCAVLVGASRKRFLGELLAAPDGTPRPVERRDYATDAVSALAAAAGAWCVRVHDVRGSLDSVLVGGAWRAGTWPVEPATQPGDEEVGS